MGSGPTQTYTADVSRHFFVCKPRIFNLSQREILISWKCFVYLTCIWLLIKCLWILADCGPPKMIHRALLSDGDTVEGSFRTYTCSANTVPEGETKIVCQNDGQWSTTSLYCRRNYTILFSKERASFKRTNNQNLSFEITQIWNKSTAKSYQLIFNTC